jgi:hypothetical protein
MEQDYWGLPMDEGMELALGFHAANNLVGALLKLRLVCISNQFNFLKIFQNHLLD